MLNTDKKTQYISKAPIEQVSTEELRYMAYTGQYELVYSTLREIPDNAWPEYIDKYVLNQTIWACIKKINKLRNIHNENSIKSECEFLIKILNEFINFCDENGDHPKELFESLISACDALIDLSEIDIADEYLQKAILLGVSRFPLFKIDVYNKLALINSKKGNIEKSLKFFDKLAKHPYLITNRNQIPEILLNLCRTLLIAGRIKTYPDLLFMGLRHFYTNMEIRRKLVKQICLSNRNSSQLLISKRVSISNKLIYLIHWSYFKLPNFGRIKLGFINRLGAKALLGTIYVLNFVIRSRDFAYLAPLYDENYIESSDNIRIPNQAKASTSQASVRKILITRAMGGIGDFLTMTPGLHALKKKYPRREIHLAIPKRYFPIFENNEDVKLIDIDEELFSLYAYNKWFNLSECPAARVESLTAPKVKKSRIDLFARGLGINGFRLLKMDRKPRFFFTDKELEFAEDFWQSFNLGNRPVIGIQVHSDEEYRDYPHMEELVKEISSKQTVLVFDDKRIKGFDFENVIKIDTLSLRQAFSLACKCDLIIGPDSSFIHLAAVFNKPSIVLAGPIDGKVRTQHYPNSVYIDIRDHLGCLPCWRNESIPCKLTGLRVSACMGSIPITRVLNELSIMLGNRVENTK